MWSRPDSSASTAAPPTLLGLASTSTTQALPSQIPPFEPYLCVKTKENAQLGVVVPQELLLPEQCAAGLVTLRLDFSREFTLPVDDVVVLHFDESLGELTDILRREASIAELMLQAKQLQQRDGGFCGAAFLHDQIPANCWGVTMTSLNRFVGAVTEKWRRG